jgi:hypothetical protein
MQGHEANVPVNAARAVLVAALGLVGASGCEVVVTDGAVTPDPGDPAAGQATEPLRQAFNVPPGRPFHVVVRPTYATFIPPE